MTSPASRSAWNASLIEVEDALAFWNTERGHKAQLGLRQRSISVHLGPHAPLRVAVRRLRRGGDRVVAAASEESRPRPRSVAVRKVPGSSKGVDAPRAPRAAARRPPVCVSRRSRDVFDTPLAAADEAVGEQEGTPPLVNGLQRGRGRGMGRTEAPPPASGPLRACSGSRYACTASSPSETAEAGVRYTYEALGGRASPPSPAAGTHCRGRP